MNSFYIYFKFKCNLHSPPLIRALEQQQVFERFKPTVLVAVCSDSLAPARMLRQLFRQGGRARGKSLSRVEKPCPMGAGYLAVSHTLTLGIAARILQFLSGQGTGSSCLF